MRAKSASSSVKPIPPPSRGKYAAAFAEGVNIVIDTKTGKRRFKVRRKADGSIIWKPRVM